MKKNVFKNSNSQKKGFTLIELLVVISIIGVLASVLLANFVGIRERAADTKAKNDLNQFKKALQLYYNDYQKYPTASGVLGSGCGTTGTESCFDANGSFAVNGTVYMKEMPSGDWRYYNQTGGAGNDDEKYVARIILNNVSDESIVESQDRCASSISDEGVTLSSSHYAVCED